MSNSEQKKQDLSRQIIGKIVNDPAFREQLTADPKGALQGSDFWETYIELYGDADVEVSGYEAVAPVSSFSDYCCITAIY
jgi:hypothetical protein